MQKKVIVFDIDGTVANIEHRRHWVQNKPKNWPAFNKAMHLDTPHADVIWLLQVLAAQEDVEIVFASGRGEEQRAVTEAWLAEIIGADKFSMLLMRPAGDFRRDDIIKEEILDKLIAMGKKPEMVFDDRNQVVDMWRRRGIRCMQVAPGDF